MYKLVALLAVLACAAAAPAPEPGLIATHAAPLVAAPVAVAHTVPVATSYANTYKVSVKSPIVAHAPVYAAPALVKTAPVVAAAAPVVHAPIAYAAHAPAFVLH